jgi:hypothetical protein
MIKALALIVGPILCGVLFFLAEAPAQTPGAYVETADGIYRLSTCEPGASNVAGVSTAAPVVAGDVLRFYLVLPDDSAAVHAQAARLYLTVVNHAESEADYGRARLATVVRRMNSRVYRFRPEQALQWGSSEVTRSVYEQALAKMPGSRATAELLVELEVPAPTAGLCRYAVSLGPPPSPLALPVKWFVPPSTEGR